MDTLGKIQMYELRTPRMSFTPQLSRTCDDLSNAPMSARNEAPTLTESFVQQPQPTPRSLFRAPQLQVGQWGKTQTIAGPTTYFTPREPQQPYVQRTISPVQRSTSPVQRTISRQSSPVQRSLSPRHTSFHEVPSTPRTQVLLQPQTASQVKLQPQQLHVSAYSFPKRASFSAPTQSFVYFPTREKQDFTYFPKPSPQMAYQISRQVTEQYASRSNLASPQRDYESPDINMPAAVALGGIGSPTNEPYNLGMQSNLLKTRDIKLKQRKKKQSNSDIFACCGCY